MTNPGTEPDLIIALSKDKVRLHLLPNEQQGRASWSTTYKLSGIFYAEDLVLALDQALEENPGLLEYFPCVHMILLDQPNFSLPPSFIHTGGLEEIALRHLRLRAGDFLTYDLSAHGDAICYTVPVSTFEVIREYYSTISCSHVSTLLWQAIASHATGKDQIQAYYLLIDNALTILAVKNDQIIFFKQFQIRYQADVAYYCVAVTRLIKPQERIVVRLAESISAFDLINHSAFQASANLDLPSLPDLVTQYIKCA